MVSLIIRCVGHLLDHLQHEGTAIPKQVISSPNPTEHLVHNPYLSRIGGYETAALGQDTDDSGLP